MLANWITLARYPLLAVSLTGLYFESPALRLAGVALLLLGLMLDTLDGIVARRRAETSLMGSVLDIAADRTYELALWICFVHLGLIPVAVPLVVLARTALTDALRAIGTAEGVAPLEQQHGRLARALVASAWARTGYSLAKVAAFGGLGLAHAFNGFPPESVLRLTSPALLAAASVVTWVAVALCVARGAPVIVEGLRRHWPAPVRRIRSVRIRHECTFRDAPHLGAPVERGGHSGLC